MRSGIRRKGQSEAHTHRSGPNSDTRAPDERGQVGVRVGLAGDLDAPRQLHHRPAGTAPAQQLAEARGVDPRRGVGPPAMIEMHPHRRAFQQRRQRDELIVDHLDVRDHVEGFEVRPAADRRRRSTRRPAGPR